MNDAKLSRAFSLLESAIEQCTTDRGNQLLHAALAKAFETTFEYLWKALKREADQAGLETYSPRDALKAAAQLKLIDDLELWNQFLNARNLSVHDYVGMEDEEMIGLVRQFRDRLRSLLT
jgi:nucleotidyltransferase substrate binding protein (TIGR01987 family)